MKKLLTLCLLFWSALALAQNKNTQYFNVNQTYHQQEFSKNLLSKSVPSLPKNATWIEVAVENDELGFEHKKFQLHIQQYPVAQNYLTAHIRNGYCERITGKINTITSINGEKNIEEEQAFTRALELVPAQEYQWENEKVTEQLEEISEVHFGTLKPTGKLMFFPHSNTYELCYEFTIRALQPSIAKTIYFSAATGELIAEYNLLHDINVTGSAHTKYSGVQTIITDSIAPDTFILRDLTRGGGVFTLDMNEDTLFSNAVQFEDQDNVWNNTNLQQDEVATDAHWASEQFYDYMLSEFNRASFDNNNHPMINYVHYNSNLVNAYFNGQAMLFGDGSGSITPLTTTDIVGHEVGHGITSTSANLVYSMESGALNESFSDIFGTAFEHHVKPAGNFTVGEEINITLRDMSNPNNYNDPAYYQGNHWHPDTDPSDYYGVHTNSGVQNYWWYLLCVGDTGTNEVGDNYSVQNIGMQKATQIAYRSLTVYLSPNSNYSDARFYSILAATDLYGVCSPEVVAVTNAWHAVGVGNAFASNIDANFTVFQDSFCAAPILTQFTNASSNTNQYTWFFGDGDSSNAINPTHVYGANGFYNVTLVAHGAGVCASDTLTVNNAISIDPTFPCHFKMMADTNLIFPSICNGTIVDHGGSNANYGEMTDDYVTIAPSNADSVLLTFNTLDIEAGSSGTNCNWDYLSVYDGNSTASPLIGSYCNNNPPPASLTSTGGAVTLHFHSDQSVVLGGFDIDFTCFASSTACNDTTINLNITDCDNYLWDATGFVYTSSGTYTTTLQSQGGCDSTLILNLTLNSSTIGSATLQGCDSVLSLSGNRYFSTSGFYIDTLTNSVGCDSLINMYVSITPSSVTAIQQSACDSFTWNVTNSTYFASGMYDTVFTGSNGCDSIIQLDLTILNGTTGPVVPVTNCGPYYWSLNGQIYPTSGTYTHTMTGANGCDSTATIQLTVLNAPFTQISNTACDSFTFNGNILTSSGTYYDTLQTVNACDSIVELTLTLHNSSVVQVSESACGTYTWPVNSVTYSQSGTYVDTLFSMAGCDSVMILNLTIYQAGSSNIYVTACDSFSWSNTGLTYQSTGVYYDTVSTNNGCDSIIAMNLTISGATTSNINVSHCDHYISPSGLIWTQSGTYMDTINNADGCDSIMQINLTILPETNSTINVTSCGPYVWNNLTFNQSGTYHFDTVNSQGCDSNITLVLDVFNFDTTIIQSGNRLMSMANADSYQWIRCDSNNAILPGETNAFFEAAVNGVYAVILTTGSCTDTLECTTINSVGVDHLTDRLYNIYPNPTSGLVTIDWSEYREPATIRVFTLSGQILSVSELKPGMKNQIEIVGAKGIYLVDIWFQDQHHITPINKQ